MHSLSSQYVLLAKNAIKCVPLPLFASNDRDSPQYRDHTL